MTYTKEQILNAFSKLQKKHKKYETPLNSISEQDFEQELDAEILYNVPIGVTE